ncbi:putative MFS-type transporter [Colletotrichum orbiculare MAFF 240422]|uniref:MFS-type transporter n=1 Tax=Colletotrichum orbiculare (strain 104-T / ATCC 96160 / CBS 514.97 / LARS 414 / MAFF 240422) TaxID=1213857 RepID=A0A484G9V7_COLOR|nr:putative MFS-type transporter [Colletotrichum orbiculare MAFF 240422]
MDDSRPLTQKELEGKPKYNSSNQCFWDERAPAHAVSPDSTASIFRCHIGTDSLSLARLGARSVTGLDFSDRSIHQARSLAQECLESGGGELHFVQADVYSALRVLTSGGFDLVYTGIGGSLLASVHREMGRYAHPVVWTLDESDAGGLSLKHPYFESGEPVLRDHKASYVGTDAWGDFENFVTVAFAVFTDVFLYGVIVPVVPFALESRLSIAQDKVQFWVSILLAVYGAALLVSSPIWGYLADRISSRRLPMVVGLLLLGGATALLCAGTNISLWIVGRLLQGTSAALVWTVGLAFIVDATASENMGKAMGWVGMAMSAGILSSPMLGGLVYSGGGYYAVFAMCFGLIAVDTAMRLVVADVKTAAVSTDGGVTSSDPQTAAGAIGLADERLDDRAVDVELRGREANKKPAFLVLLRRPRLLAALWGTLVHGVVTTSFDSTLPLLVSDMFGWDSIGAGLIFLPLVSPSLLGPLVGVACDRWGARRLSSLGFLLATPFLVCLRFVDGDSLSQKALLCVLLVGVGIGMAFVLGPLMAEVMWVVEEVMPSSTQSSYAQAYGLYNMAFSGGALLGPIIGGLIRDAADWGTVGWTLGLLTFVTSISQTCWVGGPLIKGRRP